MKRHQPSEKAAALAAEIIRRQLHPDPDTRIALVLGTGWGDALKLDDGRECPFSEIPGFEALGQLDGHARKVMVGKLAGRPVIVLSGRVHLNEAPADPNIHRMVRLQIEMLLKLGADRIIPTCAVGGLTPATKVGNVGFITGLLTLFAPDMPLYAGEFCSPEDTLDAGRCIKARQAAIDAGFDGKSLFFGAYAMIRGPFFEGRRNDKRVLREAGANVVGMSLLPELCVAALYPGVEATPLVFVTNSDTEAHSHEENLARAKQMSGQLGRLLTVVVGELAKRS